MAGRLYGVSFFFSLVVLAVAHQRRSAGDVVHGVKVPHAHPPPPPPVPVVSPKGKGPSGNREDVAVSYEDVRGGNVPVFYDKSDFKPKHEASGYSASGHAPSGAAPRTGYLASGGKRRIEDTQVDCLKTHMLVTFRFNAPFHGYIYPHNNFAKCLLFSGHNSWKAEILLKHGTCGDQENTIIYHGRTFMDPVIEHRLVIQWDRDIIGEDDSSVIVRCDRPDDYNKTVEWNLEMRDIKASYESNQHPGPRMWMEIQRGEGPRAPPLNDEVVYVGEVLTLIFTLSDNVYWFDSNILTCYALDGGDQKSQIEWDTSLRTEVSAAARVFSGETTVIEDGCSVKPKLFSHFFKEKKTEPNGDMVTLHYAHFKAFRFPTSMKIVIQCDVQVCYKTCEELPPCSEAYTPRAGEEAGRRKRRAAEETEKAKTEGSFDMERVNMFRSIEVYMPDETPPEGMSLTAPMRTPAAMADCYSSGTFIFTVLGLVVVILLFVVLLIFMYFKMKLSPPSFFSPKKNNNM